MTVNQFSQRNKNIDINLDIFHTYKFLWYSTQLNIENKMHIKYFGSEIVKIHFTQITK